MTVNLKQMEDSGEPETEDGWDQVNVQGPSAHVVEHESMVKSLCRVDYHLGIIWNPNRDLLLNVIKDKNELLQTLWNDSHSILLSGEGIQILADLSVVCNVLYNTLNLVQ